jgi:cysteinyl-tRNA synthetase
VDAAQVEALLEERRAARAARDFARADAIRQELAQMGVVIEDSAQGTRWSVAKH